jgi:drug/metabolite transporter (DMT)-like permease
MNVFVLYASTVLIWGSTWIVITFQLGVVAPEVSVAYRFALAAVLLLAYCVIRGCKMRFSASAHLGMAALGLFLFSSNYLVFYLANIHLTSGLVAVVFSSIVVANIIFGRIFLNSPIRPRVALGAGFGIAGLAIIFWPDIKGFDLAQAGTLGLVLSLVGTVLASIGNIISVANQSRGLPVLQANAYGMAYGALFMAAFAVLRGTPFEFEFTAPYIASLLYLAVFGSIIAFGCYLTLLGRIGADKGAYAAVMFPVVALALSTVFEDYQWSAAAAAGMVLVVVGNVLVLSQKRSKART